MENNVNFHKITILLTITGYTYIFFADLVFC